MKIFVNLFRSVFLSMILSFSAPVVMISLILALSYGLVHVPSIGHLGANIASQITGFLVIFGRGSPVEGMMILGLASSVAGGLFDLFNSYKIMSS